MFKTLAGIAALTIAASSALAADLPTRKPAPAPVFAAVPVFSWTGFYVGLNGGYAWGTFSGSGSGLLANPKGGMLGGTIGYNYQYGNYVIGYEGDVDYTDTDWIKGRRTSARGVIGSVRVDDSLITERLRLGYAWDRVLLFVTGGYAGADVDAALVDPARGAWTTGNWSNGYVVGAGLEYAFTNNISAKAEYLYAGFDSHRYFGGADTAKGSLGLSMVRVGLNYHF